MFNQPVTSDDQVSVRTALRSALVRAIGRRDREAIPAYRVALAAIDNAEAVPLNEKERAGAIELSSPGVAAAEVPRRSVDEHGMRDIVRGEAEDLRSAAGSVAETAPETARRLNHQADLLDSLLRSSDR